jgi:SnoaL-like protein
MSGAADELEAIRQLNARYCRFLDTKDFESWRGVFTRDVVVTLDMAVSTGGADPMTAPALKGPEVRDNFVPMVMGGLETGLTSDTTATTWRIKTLDLTRTIMKVSGDS